MKTGRFFVTLVILLGIAGVAAHVSQIPAKSEQIDSKNALVEEGNVKIKEAQALNAELQKRFKISLEPQAAQPINWKRLSRDQRREVETALAQFQQLVNRVLEIDAQPRITIDHREALIGGREAAHALQLSLENFEKIYGVNFNPPKANSDRDLVWLENR